MAPPSSCKGTKSKSKDPAIANTDGTPMQGEGDGSVAQTPGFDFSQTFGSPNRAQIPKSSGSTIQSEAAVVPIRDITIDTSSPKIQGRVSFKSPMQSWSKPTSSGQKFTLNLLDSTGEISICCFRPELFDSVQINQCVEIANFTVKPCHPSFKKTDSDFELASTPALTIKQIGAIGIPEIPFDLKTYDEIRCLAPQSSIDLVGICTDPGILLHVGTDQIPKRDIHLLDKCGFPFTLSLWRDQATTFKHDDFFSCAVRNGVLATYDGRMYINTSPNTLFWPNPPLKIATELLDWFNERRRKQP